MSQGFHHRYQLLDQVTAGAIRTHHALASTGAVVMAHFMDDAASSEGREVLTLLTRLDAEGRERIIEIGEVDGTTVIVTRFLLDMVSLRDWLRAQAPMVPNPTKEMVAAAEPPEEPAGPKPTPEMVTPEPHTDPVIPRLPDPQASAEHAAGAGPEPDPAPASSSPGSGEDETGAEPGEFTRLFAVPTMEGGRDSGDGSAPLPEETAPQPKPISPLAPGPTPALGPESGASPAVEAAAGSAGDSALPEGNGPLPAQSAPATGPGEFTRLFDRMVPPPPSPPAPTSSAAAAPPDPPLPAWRPAADPVDSYLDRLHEHSAAAPGARSPAEPPPPSPRSAHHSPAASEPILPGIEPLPPPPRPAEPGGPSEFTRIVRSAASVPAPPPVPPGPAVPRPVAHPPQPPEVYGASAEPAARRAGGTFWPVVALGVVLILTLAVLAYFALRGE